MSSLGRTMPYAEPVRRYNRTAMALHWIVAALILVNVFYGLTAASGEDGLRTRQLIATHQSIGLTVLGLVLLRVLWRIGHKPPPLPRPYARAERWAAHAAHYALYAVMLALPLSGYLRTSAWSGGAVQPLMLFDIVPFPRVPLPASMSAASREELHAVTAAAHLYIGYALYILVALHILGVLKHHAVDHVSEIGRMLPGIGGRGPRT